MRVPFVDFGPMHTEIRNELDNAYQNVMDRNYFIQGEECEKFDKEFAEYCDAKYCVGVATGLDALYLILKAMEIGAGDEVIVPSNTYIATVLGITENDAVPVFVEPDEYFNIDASKIEEKITDKTKATLVVHLYGQASNMTKIAEIAQKYELPIIEDRAQSHGAGFEGVEKLQPPAAAGSKIPAAGGGPRRSKGAADRGGRTGASGPMGNGTAGSRAIYRGIRF